MVEARADKAEAAQLKEGEEQHKILVREVENEDEDQARVEVAPPHSTAPPILESIEGSK